MSRETKLTDDQVKSLCQPSSESTCSFLTMTADGWACAKGSDMELSIRARRSSMRAQGDNCSGPPEFIPITGIDDDWLRNLKFH